MKKEEKLFLKFLNFSQPCFFDGCEKLKHEFQKELKKKPPLKCKACHRKDTIKKYRKIVTEKLKQLTIV